MPERPETVRFRHRLEALALGTAGVAAYYLVAVPTADPMLSWAGIGAAALLLLVSIVTVRDPPSTRAPVLRLTLPMAPAPPSQAVAPLPKAPLPLRAPRNRSRAEGDGSGR